MKLLLTCLLFGFVFQACSTMNPIQTSRITGKGQLVTGLGFDMISKNNETVISPVVSARYGLSNRIDFGGFANLMGFFGGVGNGIDSQVQISDGIYPSTFMLGYSYKDDIYVSYQDDAKKETPQKAIYTGYTIGHKSIFIGLKLFYNLPESGKLLISDMFTNNRFELGYWIKGGTIGYQNSEINPAPILSISFYNGIQNVVYLNYTFRWKF